MTSVQEVDPRVYEFEVAQERGWINESPLPWVAPDGELVESGCLRVIRSGKFQARQTRLHQVLAPEGVAGRGVWGPDPDSKLVEAGGSSRVWSGQCPALLLTPEQHTREVYEAGVRWVDFQTRRGCHYSHWLDPLDGKHYLGRGYIKVDGPQAGGGFSTLGNPGRVLPALQGQEYGLTGWPVPNPQHMTVDAAAVVSLTYKSYSAMLTAIGQLDAGITQMLAGEYMPSRSWGWLMKALAYGWELARAWGDLCPRSVAQIESAIDVALAMLDERAWYGTVAPDNGSTSEGGHLTGQVSDSSFYVGIALTGALDLWQIAGRSDAERVVTRCLDFLASCRDPGHDFFNDDRAPISGDVAFGVTSPRAVQARFILPGLLRLRRFGRKELSAWIDPLVEHCDEVGVWGGSQDDRGLWAAEVGYTG